MGQDVPLINLVKINHAKLVQGVQKTLVDVLYIISTGYMLEKTACRSYPTCVIQILVYVLGRKLHVLTRLILKMANLNHVIVYI